MEKWSGEGLVEGEGIERDLFSGYYLFMLFFNRSETQIDQSIYYSASGAASKLFFLANVLMLPFFSFIRLPCAFSGMLLSAVFL